jgi:hypothetical protein
LDACIAASSCALLIRRDFGQTGAQAPEVEPGKLGDQAQDRHCALAGIRAGAEFAFKARS